MSEMRTTVATLGILVSTGQVVEEGRTLRCVGP
jgi:hypothetical protein